ncbi:MAG TPA: hypothetical protein PLU30_06520 [Verrucomicrobiae bacterium]|nr:hypothetical protein [Verrucomicrobiae bacterium]
MMSWSRQVAVCAVVAAWWVLASPQGLAAGPNFELGKVTEYVNDPEYTRTRNLEDDSLKFEKKYHEYGAVTSAQRKAKRGHYFYVKWLARQPSKDIKVRFEYRQKETKAKVYALEVDYPEAKGWKRSVFSVVGDAYEKQGLVTCWRVLLMQAGQVVAEKRSFIW